MGSNELHPNDPGSVLHLHDQAVLVPGNVEHHPVVATYAGAAVLLFYVLRGLPACLDRFVEPALQGSFRIGTLLPQQAGRLYKLAHAFIGQQARRQYHKQQAAVHDRHANLTIEQSCKK